MALGAVGVDVERDAVPAGPEPGTAGVLVDGDPHGPGGRAHLPPAERAGHRDAASQHADRVMGDGGAGGAVEEPDAVHRGVVDVRRDERDDVRGRGHRPVLPTLVAAPAHPAATHAVGGDERGAGPADGVRVSPLV